MKKTTKEIDLNIIFEILVRNKFILIFLSLLGTFGTIIYTLSATPIWKGSFEIVVKENFNLRTDPGVKDIDLSILQSFNNINSNKTEELILRSPLVLKPVYEYVKNYYRDNNISRKMDYKSWRKKELNVEFEQGSNILKVEYKNSDKKLILNALNLISERYQNYSKRDRSRNIENTITYLESQKLIMKKKEKNSRIKLNKFAIKNNLVGFLQENDSDFEKDLQLPIYSLINQPITSKFSRQFDELYKLQNNYALLSTRYKPNSKTLKELEFRITKLKDALKRPQEILLEFKDLNKEALRNTQLLIKIENNLELVKLESQRINEPWELISDPTLETFKIYPNRTKMTFLAAILSFLVTASALVIRDRKKGKLFSLGELKEKLECPYMDTIYSSNWNITRKILQKTIEKGNLDEKVKLKYGLINFKNQKYLNKFIDFNEFKYDVQEFYELNNEILDKVDRLILIIDFLQIDLNDILILNKYISIENSKYAGWIYFDNKSNLR